MPTQGSKFTLFEINIQHQPRGYEHYPIVVEFTTPGNEAVTQTQGQLILDENVIRSLREHEEWGEPDKYGQTLGELLFQGPVRDALQQASAGAEMRILLAVNAPELRGLRWERLAAPIDNGWRMLARNENTPFAISLASSRHVVFPSLQQDEIKALVVVSHPKDIEARGFSAFDDQKGIKDAIVALSYITSEIDILAVEAQPGIEAALAAIEPTAVTVTHIGKPTEDRLSAALTAKAYTILHLIAHGRVDSQAGRNETYVYLANEADETARVSAKSLIDFFIHKGNLPRFAFLVSCESGRQSRVISLDADPGPGHSGLGQRLVQEAGMHAVVAMMDEITIATAERLAPKFYEWLAKHGHPDWALVRAGAGLQGRRDVQEIVPVLFSRLRGRPLYYQRYTEAAGIPLTKAEIETGFGRLQQLINERAPGLKSDWRRRNPDGSRESDALHKLKQAFLTDEPDWANLTDTVSDWSVVEWLNNLCYNLLDFDFVELAQGREATLYAVQCPFPGLKAFGIPTDPESKAAAAYFFGRDALVERLQLRLVDEPVLAVLGASGSGKSSVVMAGLVPKLEDKGLRWHYMKPGEKPLAVLERLVATAPDLIVIDQFEEIFTHVPANQEGEKERLAFIERLAAWAEDEAADHKLVLTMRADFVSECHNYERLAGWMTDHSQQVLPLTAVELRDVAWQQAANAFPTSAANGAEGNPLGLKFDPGLLNTIMSDLQEERGAMMPLLQFALRELWQRRHGRWLRANAYEELGGIGQAIAHTAEEIYQNLDKEERALMKYIFIRLTHLDESGGRGQQRRDTRHRVPLKDLVPQGRSLEQVQALIYKPEMRGLLVTSQPAEEAEENNPTGPETPRQVEVEVIHEAVIRHWQRLQKWLDSDYEMLRQRQKIQQEAHEWRRETDPEKKASLLLLHGSRLQEIKEWQTKNRLELNASEEAYVEACHDKEQKQQRKEIDQQRAIAEEQQKRAQEAEIAAIGMRRRRDIAFGLAAGALILAVLAGILYRTAETSAAEAREAQQIAESRSLAIQASRYYDDQYDLALLLSVQARHSVDTLEAWAAQLSTLAYNPHIVTYFHEHDAPVTSVAVSSDGNILASGDAIGHLVLRNLSDDTVLYNIPTDHSAPIMRLQFNTDSSQLVSASFSDYNRAVGAVPAQVKLWDMATGEKLLDIAVDTKEEFRNVAISPDAQHAAFLTTENQVIIWDIELNRSLAQSDALDRLIRHVSFLGDSDTLLWQGYELENFVSTLEVWDLSQSVVLTPVTFAGHINSIEVIATSPDGRLLASTSYDGRTILSEIMDGSLVTRFDNSFSNWTITIEERGIAFSPDSSLLALGGVGEIFVYNAAFGWQQQYRLTGHSGNVLSLAFSTSPDLLVSGSEDGKVILWNLNQSRLRHARVGWQSIIFSDSGNSFAALTGEQLTIFDTESFRPQTTFSLTLPASRLWAFTPDEQAIIISNYPVGDEVFLLDVKTGKQIGDAISYAECFQLDSHALSSDGRYLASTCTRGNPGVFLYDISIRQAMAPLTDDSFTGIAFTPGSSTLAAGTDNGTIYLWDTERWEMKGEPLVGHLGWVLSLAFSPDAQLLASAGQDRIIRLWDLNKDLPSSTPLLGHTDWIRSIAFSQDGSLLASTGDEGIILLWDIDSGRQIGRLNSDYSQLMFNPDPGNLLLANGDSIWDLNAGNWSAMACNVANRNLSLSEWNLFFNSDRNYELTCSTLPAHPSIGE